MSMLRGEDATGVAGIREVTNEDKQKIPVISVYKRAIHAVDYMNTKGFSRILDRFGDYHYVLGHVRASTVGGALDMNAHPFIYGDITLIHNGTVNKHNLKVKADEDVDSAHIALAVATHGEIPALEMLDGGYSLVWHNAEDDTINFARNERKPMALAYVKSRNELYYASEYRVLWAVLGRNGIEIDGDIKVPAINTHYKFHKEDLRKMTATPYKAYTSRPFHPDAWNGSHQRPVIHGATKDQQKSMVTHSGAHAQNAENSTESGQKETSDTGTKAHTITTTDVVRPKPERINKLNELLKDYGWGYETSLVLQPTHYAAPDPKKGHLQGRLYLEMVDSSHQPPHIEFCMYWVSPTRADWFEGIGRVAIKIDNFLQQTDGTLRIIVKESSDLQKVIERADEVLKTLEAHGFGPESKEGSKSNEQADDEGFAQITYNPITGEVLEEDPTAHIGSDLVRGPGGTSIAFREFRELCKGGCGLCDGDIDPQLPGQYSWSGSSLICEGCTNDPNKQHELGRWTH